MLGTSALALVFALSAQTGEAPEANLAPPAGVDDETEAEPTMEPVAPVAAKPHPAAASIEDAFYGLISQADEVLRVAIVPSVGEDAVLARQTESALARAVLDAGYEVITADHFGRLVPDADGDGYPEAEMTGVLTAADHVLLHETIEAAGARELVLKMIHVETGRVVGVRAIRQGTGRASSVDGRTVRGAVAQLADEIFTAMQKVPGDLRYQRLAVLPFSTEDGEAERSGVAGYLQRELSRAMAARGFLMVERANLDTVLGEIGVATLVDAADAPRAGLALDAQALVVGTLATAGDRFVVAARVLDTESGEVAGTGQASLPRENAVLLSNSAIETKSALGATYRSAVAPGWGQYYNDEPLKAFALGGATYTLALFTLIGGIASGIGFALYQTYAPNPGTSNEAQKQEVVLRRQVTNGLIWTTLAGLALTSAAWGFTVSDALLVGLNNYE